MSNWISKATNAFKGDDSSSSQAFELFCDCGQKHTGLRRAKWQRIVCRVCGGSLFVLQRDPYPAPKEKPEQHPSRVMVEEEIPVVQHEENEYEAPSPARPEAVRPLVAPATSAPKRKQPELVAAPSREPRSSASGFWKPFRLILLAIVFLGGVTGFVMYRSSQRTSAERSLKDSIDKIKVALPAGEWVEARNQLEIAVRSLDRLGRQNSDATRYRQQLKETTALTGLLSQPLSELLTEATRAQASGETELAAFQFKAKGQWLILEGQVEPISNDAKSSRVRYRIPLPCTVGKADLSVEVVLVSTDMSRLMAKSEAEAVVVAIQIEAIELSEDQSTWQIIAKPESTVLWTDRLTYLGIGYLPEDADSVAATLSKQSNSLGVTDAPSAP